MFETETFREQLQSTIALAIGPKGAVSFDDSIPVVLQFLARANEDYLMQIERRLPLRQQRGISAALDSTTSLLSSAADIARAERRRNVSLDDVLSAYKARFCQFWPFCR